MPKTFPILYSKSATGAVLTWQVEVNEDSYRTTSGQLNSLNLTTSLWSFCEPKNVGKKNETSSAEQAEKEAEALFVKKQKDNYWENLEDFDKIKFFAPMLAEKYRKYKKKMKFPVGVSNKLNGIRSNHFIDASFSRTGEQFHNIEHIRESTAPLYQKFPNLFLDGELFNKKYKNLLNRISELVSVNMKPKDITPELREESRKIVRLVVYDGFGFNNITQETPYEQRIAALEELLAGFEFIDIEAYEEANSHEEIEVAFKAAEERKDEGIIIRILDAPYLNKRTKFLLKYKHFEDEEFEILDIEPGTGNWQGCAKKIICKLNTPATNGKTTFKSNIRGEREDLRALYENKEKYIGQKANVEFQEYSEYGIPLIPYTQQPFIRNYE